MPTPNNHPIKAIDLNTAIARLTDFGDTYPEGEQIDGDMPLTVDDARLVIAAAKRHAVEIERNDTNA